MSEGGRRNTELNSNEWEAELWSYLSQGDGINCPIYESCTHRMEGGWCISDHKEYFNTINRFVDEDNPDPETPINLNMEFLCDFAKGRIFWLVRELAYKYQDYAGIDQPPVPYGIVSHGGDNLPIEVRQVPMKSHHGAVWKLRDCWVIQLNSNDTIARQRFTYYHEVFHILAHCRSTPIFKKTSGCEEGTFNELLADHFAAIMLMPEEIVRRKWEEIRDIDEMAAVFQVPKSLVLIAKDNLDLR